ncbi:tetratricopeptide (TPR) repeat protein [Bradyrhizobium sp. USDA 3686]|uniref:tetratricopeptide repeat protein n=1 Tax=Bradyrhizobium canariense TaxID=255045 RepID=UPI00195797F4|nr:tetratricopeptide repeat protein [Bradyrhizobium canariense]MBM7482342.1 tetratricopeptide (TPR) repeat protein [Bradyrhizobium canariense]
MSERQDPPQLTGLPVHPPLPSFSVTAGQEIPKPKDWQDFQRGCVALFQAELNDPHAQEYGRNGQKQLGIDVLGRRDGVHDHFVGIQCRRYDKPLKKAAILKDCRDALSIKAGLKEIIFATTCPSDARATDAALEVEAELRAEGHDLKVILYSWSDLELKICQHQAALPYFFPAAIASTAAQSMKLDSASVLAIAEAVARVLPAAQALVPADVKAPTDSSEDPALHAKIDLWRDLFRTKNAFVHAKEGLLELKSKEDLSGKPWADFRIETNLGSVAINLGRHDEAAAHFERAYSIRPNDCNAIANLALARTIMGRHEEAMELAKVALDSTPRSDQAVSYLLQAAARSSWQGDPETLIPVDLVGSVHADLGLAEFLRKRNAPDWAERTRELARNHLDLPEFRRLDAIAVLELALGPDVFVGKPGIVSRTDLERAADETLAMADACLASAYADQYDLMAYVNNAAVLLRLTGRQADCEALLARALPVLPDQPHLRRLLALAQAAQNRFDAAEVTLRNVQDRESRLLAAEMVARRDTREAIKLVEDIDAAGEDHHLAELKWRILGDLGLRVRDYARVDSAIAGLASLPNGKLLGDLLQLRRDAQTGTDEKERHARLIELASGDFTLANNVSRYLVADEMRNQGLPAEAAKLIEPVADLQVLNPATRLYLSCLVEARRDEAFRDCLASASSDVRNDPEILWLLATHSWNIGDLPESRRAVETLLRAQPDSAAARLLKIEISLRSDNVDEVLQELERPIERLAISRLSDKFRIASLLGHFGHTERAVAYAYKLFLENREVSQAWLCFHGLVLQEGTKLGEVKGAWDVDVVGENTGVDIEYESGEKQFIVVEPDGALRRLDEDSWEPDHPLVQAITGLIVGAQFTNPVNGKVGTIRLVRHKYVAKHHFVLNHHEARFPTVAAIRSIPVDVSTPEGLAPLLEELKAKHDWIEQEQESYKKAPWPLAVLAQRTGCDTIDVAEGLAAQELRLKVASGTQGERNAAVAAIVANLGQGCVLDLHAFWTCWRLGALGSVVDVCGLVHIAQSTMDQLLARRERISHSAERGYKGASYRDGKMAITEVAPEHIQQALADIDRAIEWARTHAVVCPLVVPEKAPQSLRDFLRDGPGGVFDSSVVALQKGLLLVTDDMPTRGFSGCCGIDRNTWLQPVFMVAADRNKINAETYTQWTAHLIGAGHNYVCVSGQVLIRAALMDADAGKCPDYFFGQVVKMLGGATAEMTSHIRVAAEFLRYAWGNPSALSYRESATDILLQHLVRERPHDRREILRAVKYCAREYPRLVRYLTAWSQGRGADSPRSSDLLEGATKTVSDTRKQTSKKELRNRDRAWREAQKRKPRPA